MYNLYITCITCIKPTSNVGFKYISCPRLMEAERSRVRSEFQMTGAATWKLHQPN